MSLPLVPYNWYFINSALPALWMPYFEHLKGHAMELANIINELAGHIDSLKVWSIVVEGLSGHEKQHAVVGYAAPLATLCLNMPYVIRSRYYYSISHLSHQANRTKDISWIDNLPANDEIWSDSADKYGSRWKMYKKLKLALETIANREYDEETGNFRNKYNHQYSPRIEVGYTEFVRRTVDDKGGVSYGLGHTEPLPLVNIIDSVERQHSRCVRAFSRYQALVKEQIMAINNA